MNKIITIGLLLAVLHVRHNAVNGFDYFLDNGGMIRCVNTDSPDYVELENCHYLIEGVQEDVLVNLYD